MLNSMTIYLETRVVFVFFCSLQVAFENLVYGVCSFQCVAPKEGEQTKYPCAKHVSFSEEWSNSSIFTFCVCHPTTDVTAMVFNVDH